MDNSRRRPLDVRDDAGSVVIEYGLIIAVIALFLASSGVALLQGTSQLFGRAGIALMQGPAGEPDDAEPAPPEPPGGDPAPPGPPDGDPGGKGQGKSGDTRGHGKGSGGGKDH